jgi:hypothetical protein
MIVFFGWGGAGEALAPVAALVVFFVLLVDFFVTISYVLHFVKKSLK